MKAGYIILLVSILAACQKEQVVKLNLEEVMAEKKKTFLLKEEKECKEKAFDEARYYVDSLANKWVQDDLIDTIKFPTKPVRPERPDDILEKH